MTLALHSEIDWLKIVINMLQAMFSMTCGSCYVLTLHDWIYNTKKRFKDKWFLSVCYDANQDLKFPSQKQY